MLEQYGGNMVILNVAVDGQPASFDYTAETTAIQIDLSRVALKPGQSADRRSDLAAGDPYLV